jgi:hypothetical protein
MAEELRPPVKPKTLMEIHQALKEYLPGKQTSARRTLEEGMRKAQDLQKKYREVAAHFEPGDFNPAPLPAQEICNVDILISRKLGGRRIDNLIEWVVKEGTFHFNWVTGEVKKV